ncbi:MAG: 3-hydroxyacyl-CoA dehydrogenase family protein, partial [Chloroflexota bacterium]|nr:3-hydroxyacyl-CoA dehydrogenase family protein [Chloroflexota bacterium]
MRETMQRVAVLGAGTMGAAIAGHCANAGLIVTLLDIAPDALTPDEEKKGLTLESRAVRDRLVRAGYERMIQSRPASLYSGAVAERISLGNFTDDFARVGEADWIIEVIIEQLTPKQTLMARIEATRKPGSIVTSNTSGIPLHQIAAGRSEEFRRHFLGTHFFNPPRYMKLLEIIPTTETDSAVVAQVRRFAERTLGKGTVLCKDTPNFIANRIGTYSGMTGMRYALDNGFSIEEVDALTGPLIGRPKTASFRLADLAGVDIMVDVAEHLYDLVPD